MRICYDAGGWSSEDQIVWSLTFVIWLAMYLEDVYCESC